MSNQTPTNAPNADGSAGRVIYVALRKVVTAFFALTGAFTIGLILVLAVGALSGDDDRDWYDDEWDYGLEQDTRLFPDDEPNLGSGEGLFPDHGPSAVSRSPEVGYNNTTNIEYRTEATNTRIDVRHDGQCENDAYYSVTETNEEIRITVHTRSNRSGCDGVEWTTLRLRDEVGDRIIVNAEAGFTARPVLS